MLHRERLERLGQAARAGDWALAGEEYIELSLAARGSRDRFLIEALAPYVRLRDANGIAKVVHELLATDPELGKQVREGDAESASSTSS